jgi:hypothetical protein
MIALSLTFLLYLASSPAWALQGDVAEALSSHIAAQNGNIEQELADYLDQDDIPGALAFVEKLAADGDIDVERRQSLEDRIWRTKTQRMLDYSKKIREAIKISDLDAMRDYNRRLRRLRDSGGSGADQAPTTEADKGDEVAKAEPSEVSKPALGASEPRKPDEAPALTTATDPTETDAASKISANAEPLTAPETSGPAGGPVLGFPPAKTTRSTESAPASTVSLEPGRVNGLARPPVTLGNRPSGGANERLIADLIDDLLERGDQAIAEYHLTVSPEGTDSALGIVEKLLIIGSDGRPAAEELGQKILATYEDLVQRDVERGLYDKASAFIERMDDVAETVGLPRSQIEALRAELDAAN